MAIGCGFDMVELHCAHGYLLSSFITPLANQRTDEYGGSLDNRLRFPLEVFSAMRAAWPADRPMSVRISAHGLGGGRRRPATTPCGSRRRSSTPAPTSSTSPPGRRRLDAKPVYGRMWQTPFSDRIRNEGRHPDDRGGQHHRARSGELDHRRRTRRSLRARAPAPERPRVDAARRRGARLPRPAVAVAVSVRQATARTARGASKAADLTHYATARFSARLYTRARDRRTRVAMFGLVRPTVPIPL